ncbi:erythropoietin receptor [Dromaius novaehollandiae]|uniref:erythropoietin receptor n=1 Tax=Dromaius novaehollandiae TaxID=8790 RepID=UPI00311EBB38
MRGPGVLLALGVLLAGARGGAGGTAPPGDFDLEASLLLAAEPRDPKCFSRRLHDLTCFWESSARPDPRPFRLQYRLESEAWRSCPLAAARTPWNTSRFSCSLPPADAVAFVPLELRVLRAPGRALLNRTLLLDQVVLLGPPGNVSAGPGGAAGQLCVRWQPPPSPYLESSLAYEVAAAAPGAPPRTVSVPAGRTELRVGSLRPRTPYTFRVRVRPDGVSYGGYWSAWSAPATATTPPEWDPLILALSCVLALFVLLLALLGLLGHRRSLKRRLWPAVPGPERGFRGLFSDYGGNFQLWLCQGTGPPAGPPEPEAPASALEEVGAGPPPAKGPPPGAPPGPSPAPSFEYTLFDPGSALLCPPAPPPPRPYANLAPPKGPPPAEGGPPAPPPYVLCS